MWANHLALFPKLLDQSQFNRRARNLDGLLEQLRRFWIQQMGDHFEHTLVMDTKPVPVIGYQRSKRHSDFVGSATYGHCASRNMKFLATNWLSSVHSQGCP